MQCRNKPAFRAPARPEFCKHKDPAAGIFKTENAAASQCQPRLIFPTRSQLRNDVDVFQRCRVTLDQLAGGDLLEETAHDLA